MPRRRVLALDPGEKVGWAMATILDDGTWLDLYHGIMELRECAEWVFARTNSTFLDGDSDDPHISLWNNHDVIVCEDWALHEGKEKAFIGSRFPSVRFIGAVQLCGWVAGIPVVMQQPAQKKATVAWMSKLDPELHAMVTRKGDHDDLHDMDALIHLYRWTCLNTKRMEQG